MATNGKETVKEKKVPYTFLIDPQQLQYLKDMAENNSDTVSEYIRDAIDMWIKLNS